jgi:phospholipase C
MLTRRTLLKLMGASGVALTGSEFLAQTVAHAAPAHHPKGSNGIQHVVILMMENRSFDHFLGWLPGADGRHDLTFLAPDGNFYPNYELAPDFQGCGYSDPDHSWEGFLVQHNFGKMDGFLQRPTAPADNPGVTLAKANTFPIGYYTNLHKSGKHKVAPDLPVIGALAENYTVLDRYFASFAGETFPNRFYQHAAQTDRDHNTATTSVLPTIWDMLSPIPNSQGVPTGAYFFRDLPFLGLWGAKYLPFWHAFYDGEPNAVGIPLQTKSFIDTVAAGELPNVSFIDPAFDTEGNGTSADDHPLAHIALGERFIADAYHALSNAGYLDNTVFMITFDEWGGFYDHVAPPQVIDDTNPANVDHTGDSTTPTDGQLIPDYTQLGFRVPAIVVSNLAHRRVFHDGPFEHTSTLALIESTFGLPALTARDANTNNLSMALEHRPRTRVPHGTIPTSAQVPGPANDAAAVCSASSTQSVSPAPIGNADADHADLVHPLARSGYPTGSGMVGFGQELKKKNHKL